MPDNIKERNADSPGLNIEYSILEIGDNIRKKSKAAEFEVKKTYHNVASLVFITIFLKQHFKFLFM